jgi:hypothetical protein
MSALGHKQTSCAAVDDPWSGLLSPSGGVRVLQLRTGLLGRRLRAGRVALGLATGATKGPADSTL